MLTCPFRNGEPCDDYCALRIAFKCAIKVLAEKSDDIADSLETMQKDLRQINQKTK